MKRKTWKQAVAWLLTMAMIFGNGSFSAFANETVDSVAPEVLAEEAEEAAVPEIPELPAEAEASENPAESEIPEMAETEPEVPEMPETEPEVLEMLETESEVLLAESESEEPGSEDILPESEELDVKDSTTETELLSEEPMSEVPISVEETTEDGEDELLFAEEIVLGEEMPADEADLSESEEETELAEPVENGTAQGYEYFYPYDARYNSCLLGEPMGFGSTVSYRFHNPQNPEETVEGEAPITGIDIVSQTPAEGVDSEVVSVGHDEEENNWWLNTENYGSATFKIRHLASDAQDEKEEVVSETFDIYVNRDTYSLNIHYPELDSNMLTNREMEISTTLYHRWDYGDGDFGEENMQEYRLQIVPLNEESAPNVSFREDDHTIVVQSGETTGEWEFEAAAFVPGDEPEQQEYEVCRSTFMVKVYNGFYRIRLANGEEARTLAPGKTMSIEPKLYQVTEGEDGTEQVTEITENVQYRWEGWEPDLLEISDAEHKTLGEGEGQESGGAAPFTVKKLQNASQSPWLIAELLDEGEVARVQLSFEEQNYDVSFENLRGGDWTWLYSDEELEMSLRTAYLDESGVGDYTVEWMVGTWNYEENTFVGPLLEEGTYYTVNEDGTSITLKGAEMAKRYIPANDAEGLNVEAHVKLNAGTEDEAEIAVAGSGVDVRDPRQEFFWPNSAPGENEMLPGSDLWFDRNIGGYIENKDFPDGSWDIEAEITNIEVAESGEWDDEGNQVPGKENVVSIEQDEEGNWKIHAEDYGYAKLRISYTASAPVSDPIWTEEGTYDEFEVYVSGDRWYINWHYPSDNRMLMNSTMEISGRLVHEWLDEDGNQQSEPVDDYRLEIATHDENGQEVPDYDAECISAEVSGDGHTVIVHSGNCEGGQAIGVRAYWDEDAQLYQNLDVYVTNTYEEILPAFLQDGQDSYDVPAGAELDLNIFQPTIIRRSKDDEGNPDDTILEGENYRIRLAEWDASVWTVKESTQDDLIPVLVRNGLNALWGTSVVLVAEERAYDENGTPSTDEEGQPIWEELARRDYQIDGLDYQMEIEYSYGDDEHNNVFEGAPLTLWAVQPEGSRNYPEGYRVVWSWGEYKEDGTLDMDGRLVTCEENQDDQSLTMTANLGAEGENDREWVNVQAAAFIGDAMFAERTFQVQIRRPVYDYRFPLMNGNQNERTMFPGETLHISKDMICYVEDEEHPDGMELPATVTKAEVMKEFVWGEDDEEIESDVVEFEETGDGWDITGLECGNARLQLTCEGPNEGMGSTIGGADSNDYMFDVVGDIWTIDWVYPNTGDFLLAGDTMTVGSFLTHRWLDENQEIQEEPVEDYRLQVDGSDEGTPSYNPEWGTVEITQDKSVQIQSSGMEHVYAQDIWITAFQKDETTGNYDSWAGNAPLRVQVVDWYCIVSPETLTKDERPLNIAAGGELDLNGFPYTVECFSVNPDVQSGTMPKEEYRIRLLTPEEDGWDESAWSVKDGTQNNLIPVLVRKDSAASEPTEVTLVAEIIERNEDGDPIWDGDTELWSEIGRRTYQFDAVCAEAEHKWTEIKERRTEPTCTTAGESAWYCEVCSIEKTEVIPAAGHSLTMKHEAKAATCTEAGTKEYYSCSVCGKNFGDAAGANELADLTVPAAGHKLTKHAAKAATCTAVGTKEYYSCSVCGKNFGDAAGANELADLTVPAAGHDWSSWEKSKEATFSAPGQESRICRRCRKEETREAGQPLKLGGVSQKLTLKIGKSKALKPTITPSGVKADFSYRSSNKKIAEVSKTGVIKAKKAGTVTITVKAAVGSDTAEVKCKVKVSEVKCKSLSGLKSKITLKKGKSQTLKPKAKPAGTTDKVKFKSSNKKVVTVNASGKLTAKKKGKATITVTCGKVSKKIKVTVK